MRVLVLGLGNILLTDEGLGVRAIEDYRAQCEVPDGVDVVDGGTAGMDLIDIIAGHDVAIVVDAIRTGKGPGAVVVLHDDEVPAVFRQGLSPHQLGLPDVLAAMALLDLRPPKLILIGTEPLEIKPGIGVSPGVEAAMPTVVATIARQVALAGIPPGKTSHGNDAVGL
jgi:hydrogenase maturation protease